MIERIDQDYWQGKFTTFVDEGPATRGATTRRFKVYETKTAHMLGYIRWNVRSFGYGFYSLNDVCSPGSLREIAKFCEDATFIHKNRIEEAKREHPMKPKKLVHRPSVFARSISKRADSRIQITEAQQQAAAREEAARLSVSQNGLVEGILAKLDSPVLNQQA